MLGIDVSEHQGVINWEQVKNQIDFAILRVGYGDNVETQDDKYFIRNADECTRLDIDFGVYIYSYATTIEQAKSEAEHVLRLIQKYNLTYPIYYDLEDEETTGTLDNENIAAIAKTFCDIIENSGYNVGIYANTFWFNNKLTDNIFDSYDKWVAEYNDTCNYGGNYTMWQFTDSFMIDGIDGYVDTNYCYVNYPKIINKTPTKAPQRKYRNLVIYANDVDKRAAEYLADYFSSLGEDGKALNVKDYKIGMGVSVWAIGGGLDNIKANVKIKGKNRFETLKAVCKKINLF